MIVCKIATDEQIASHKDSMKKCLDFDGDVTTCKYSEKVLCHIGMKKCGYNVDVPQWRSITRSNGDDNMNLFKREYNWDTFCETVPSGELRIPTFESCIEAGVEPVDINGDKFIEMLISNEYGTGGHPCILSDDDILYEHPDGTFQRCEEDGGRHDCPVVMISGEFDTWQSELDLTNSFKLKQ